MTTYDRSAFNVGDWVRYSYESWNGSYTKRVTSHAYAKLVAIDGERVTLEHWAVAKLTNRRVAFGQRIDKTPFRQGGIFYEDLASLSPVAPVIAKGLEAKLAIVMRYPTKGQRDYARAKRRKERAAR